MPSKKRAYLQQFGIIHLPNPDLTYIKNPERETKLYLCPSTSWKLKSGTLLCYLFLFSPSHLTRNHDANRAPRAYIYALEAGFSQVAKNCQVFCQTVGGVFLTFLPKIKDGNSICQTLGDSLTSSGAYGYLLVYRKGLSIGYFKIEVISLSITIDFHVRW